MTAKEKKDKIVNAVREAFDEYREAHKDSDMIKTTSELVEIAKAKGIVPKDFQPSDYCYNRLNGGMDFTDKDDLLIQTRLFEYLERGKYQILGMNYPYTGDVWHKPKGGKEEKVGEWKDGKYKKL